MKRIFYSTLYSLLIFSSISLFAQTNGENSVNSQILSTANIKSLGRDIQLSIYPQPSTGSININYSNGQIQNPKVMVYDLLGNLVNTIESERINPTTFTIDLSDKKPGYYFVKIQSDNGTVSRRITIKQ